MANVVSIQIQVNDNGSVQVIDRNTQALDQLGASGQNAGTRIASGLDHAGGHVTTNLDKVRLLSQEFGLRLPRALESMIARVPALTNLIGGLTEGMVGLAAIEIGVRAIDGIHQMYESVFDVNKEVAKYLEQSGKAADTRLFDDASLETSLALLREANAQIASLEEKRHNAGADQPGGGFLQYLTPPSGGFATGMGGTTSQGAMPPPFSSADDATLALAMANRDISSAHVNDFDRKYALQRFKDRNAAAESSLQGYAQASRQHDDALKEADAIEANVKAHENELHRATKEKREAQLKGGMTADDPDLVRVHEIDPDALGAGAAAAQLARDKANADYAAKQTELTRKERDERITAQNEAINAGIQGEARFTAMREEAIDAVKRKALDGELSKQGAYAITESIRKKFDNEAAERLKTQMRDAQRMLDDAEASGLKGVPRIQAEHDHEITRINTDPTLLPQAAAAQRKAAEVKANKDIQQLQEEFTKGYNQMMQERMDASLGAIGRVEAAAVHAKADLNDFFEGKWGTDHSKWSTDVQAKYATGGAAIDTDTNRQKSDVAQRNLAEQQRYVQEATQAEARVRSEGLTGWTNSYRAAIAQIREMEDGRLKDAAEQVRQLGLKGPAADEAMAARRVQIERTADAEIQSQAQAAQRQLASTLEEAFTNPVDFIKQKMEQMFFEIIAAWIMRTKMFQSFFGTAMNGMQPGAQGGIGASVARALGIGGGGAPAGTAGVIQGGVMLPSSSSSGASDASLPTAVMGYRRSAQDTASGEDYSSTAAAARVGGGYSGTAGGGAETIPQAISLAQHVSQWLKPKGTAAGAGGGDDDDAPAWGTRGDAEAMQHVGGGPTAGAALSTAAGYAATGYAAYQGGKGVYDSFFQTGAKGALDGTMSGMEAGASIGTMIMPGVGTVIGGAIGAVAGLTTNLVGQLSGEAGQIQARDYYRSTLQPQIEAAKNGFLQNGTGSYLSAESEIDKDAAMGYNAMSTKFGKSAADYVKSNYLNKEVAYARSEIEQMVRGGGAAMTASAAEFHGGGTITGFRDFATSGNEGFIHAMMGEGVVNADAMRAHAPMVHAINSGADAGEMASRYLAASSGGRVMGGGGGTTNHYHSYNALDMKSFRDYLDGGGAEEINKAQNRRTSLYSGDAIG